MGKNYVIILAAGSGERAGYNIPKQFIKIAGKTVIEHTLDIFEAHEKIDRIIIVVNAQYRYLVEDIVTKSNYKKIYKVLNGGYSRKESSYIGITSIADNNCKVLIHDAVRPFVSRKIIDDCLEALDHYQAVDVAISSADTIVDVNEDRIIQNIPSRKRLMRGQTPQAFHIDILRQAHKIALERKEEDFTDDCGLILKYQIADVYVVKGEEKNIKITYVEDISFADKLFQLKTFSLPDISLDGLNDKVVVAFGGSYGIGREIVQQAQGFGAKTYSFSRSNFVDVSNFEQILAAISNVNSKEGRIDYVVNTAGVLNIGKLVMRDTTDIIDEFFVNYMGNIHVIKASYPYLRNSRGSILLFTSSSYTRGRALYGTYSSSKAALVNLVQSVSEEFQDDGIRINIINPERTATPMRERNFGKESPDSLLSADDVAVKSLQTLLSDLTGQVIDVRRQKRNKCNFLQGRE